MCSTCDAHLAAVLAKMAGPGAIPREDQATAVHALVADRSRVLVVQATGWGKSAVYWAATRGLREQGSGATLVVSPLLALMRDQVAAATAAGLTAATVNSSNIEEWDDILARVERGEIDVLLVSPERLANSNFATRLPRVLASTSLIVIDEAHSVSDWGHDFRPDYLRVSTALMAAGPTTAVLATTATANQRVTDDVAAQLGEATLVLRGSLARSSLQLAVVAGLSSLERYAWVADALGSFAGSGIVYVLTVAESERLAGFLSSQGHEVASYSSALDTEERQRLEDRLRRNDVKALVATSALGMGYDKPDLGFVIHVGSPSSPVAYYQQVGRAGRGIDHAVAVLLPSDGDEQIWEHFATASLPTPEHVASVLAALESGPSSVAGLESSTSLRRGRIEALVKLLAVDGVVERNGSLWSTTGAKWDFDAERFAALRETRRREADIMRDYVAGSRCLMEHLQTSLDDPDPDPCGRCSVCAPDTAPRAAPEPDTVSSARSWLRTTDVVLAPRKLWPSGFERRGRIVSGSEGRALAFADDPAWTDELAFLGNLDSEVPPELLAGLVEVLGRWRHRWDARPVAVVPVPSRSRPVLVRSLATGLADVGRLPMIEALTVAGPRPPRDANSATRAAALLAGLSIDRSISLPPGPVLLVDDTWRTGWTATVAGALLREAGAADVMPLVLHQLP
jgi:ATP-dependent DNA helicase RecQ